MGVRHVIASDRETSSDFSIDVPEPFLLRERPDPFGAGEGETLTQRAHSTAKWQTPAYVLSRGRGFYNSTGPDRPGRSSGWLTRVEWWSARSRDCLCAASHRAQPTSRFAKDRAETTRARCPGPPKRRRSPVTRTALGSASRICNRCPSPPGGRLPSRSASRAVPAAAMSVRITSISGTESPWRRRIRGRLSTSWYSARSSTESRNRKLPSSIPARIRAVGESGSPARRPLTTTLVSMTAGPAFNGAGVLLSFRRSPDGAPRARSARSVCEPARPALRPHPGS